MRWEQIIGASPVDYLIGDLGQRVAFMVNIRDGWAGYSWDGVLIARATMLVLVRRAVEDWARGALIVEYQERACNICRFWEDSKSAYSHSHCRVNPPTCAGWPTTACMDWCGQFQPIPIVRKPPPSSPSPDPTKQTLVPPSH
jgi:hypothetical protein